MKVIVTFVILKTFASGIALADGWLCEEEASQRKGDQIYSCGIGIGSNENRARAEAFNNALAEFKRVCGFSSDCRDREASLEPARTECKLFGEAPPSFQCYRLLIFHLGGREKASEWRSRTPPLPKSKSQKLIGSESQIWDEISLFTPLP